MIIDITKLKSGIEMSMSIDTDVEVDDKFLENTNIIKFDELHLEAQIMKDYDNKYYIDGKLTGTMVLPDSLTLKPVKNAFEAEIIGDIAELLEEIGENDKKTGNTIDIFPILWENILMEIPMRVVDEESSNIKFEGNGWKLVRDDEESNMNPELQKLRDLLQ